MKKIVLVLAYLIIPRPAVSQGCSDSGFCTMGAVKPDQMYVGRARFRLNSIELTQHLGHTKYGDWIHSSFLDANVGLGNKTSLQVRLPAYTIVEGNMPTTKGWGDLLFNFSRKIFTNDDYQVCITTGLKIYTRKANTETSSGLSMPMYQQTSHGSNDLNFGASLMNRKWQLAIGYQHSLNQTGNKFDSRAWQGNSLYGRVKIYAPSAGLERGDDLMLRAERNFRLSRLNFHVGILNLWRITLDKTLDANGFLTPVRGSGGLASNLVTGGGYQFNTTMGLRLLLSFKLKERQVNTDGLQRNFIAQLTYVFRF